MSVEQAINAPSIFAPISAPASAIRGRSFLVLAITAAIFAILLKSA
jgi:hypothetical protein